MGQIVARSCRSCGMGPVYCQCVREIDRHPCCDECSHEDHDEAE